jgi:MFS family permease
MSDAWAALAIGMIGPIYAIFVERIGGDILDASWAYFAFMITTGAIIYLIGHWEDRIKHKQKFVVLGYGLKALGCLSYLFVYNQITLIITQIILGLSEAIYLPAYDALYSKYLDKYKEASEWGDWEAMRYVVAAIAALLGGYVAYELGFKSLFVFMFVFSLIGLFVSLDLFKKKKR